MAEITFTDLEKKGNSTLFILIRFAFYLFTFALTYCRAVGRGFVFGMFFLFWAFKTNAGYASAVNALYVKEKAVVANDFAGLKYTPRFVHEEAGDGRVSL